MKRIATVLSALAVAMLLTLSAYADEDSREYPPYGPGWGMGYGMGPGMMGPGMMGGGPGWGMGYGMGPGMMGPGMMGGGPGWGMGFGGHMGAVLAQLPPEQREMLRSFHFGMRRQMIAKWADLAQARLTLAEAMQRFPLERDKALDAFAKLNQARREMFELRLAAMAQVQQIVGQELWERMHAGPGFGPGMGMGPGMMGPGRGPGMGPNR